MFPQWSRSTKTRGVYSLAGVYMVPNNPPPLLILISKGWEEGILLPQTLPSPSLLHFFQVLGIRFILKWIRIRNTAVFQFDFLPHNLDILLSRGEDSDQRTLCAPVSVNFLPSRPGKKRQSKIFPQGNKPLHESKEKKTQVKQLIYKSLPAVAYRNSISCFSTAFSFIP